MMFVLNKVPLMPSMTLWSKAKLEDMIVTNLDSTYYYSPEVIPTDIEIRRWHYSPKSRKYFMVPK